MAIRGNKDVNESANRLRGGKTEKMFHAVVPDTDRAIEVFADDGVEEDSTMAASPA